MIKPVITAPFDKEQNLHSDDKALLAFINKTSKSFNAISNMAAFADDLKITRSIACKALCNYMVVNRWYFDGQSAGNDIEKVKGGKNAGLFDYEFNLPLAMTSVPEEKHVLLNTVETFNCAPEERCSKCDGSGTCSSCSGRRSRVCTSCGGKGYKREKRPSGGYDNSRCFWCSGDGRIDCSSCSGRGRCQNCAGSGRLICSRCNGTTYYQTYKGFSTTIDAKSKEYFFAADKALEQYFEKTVNKTVYEDDIIEWSSESEIIYDKREEIAVLNDFSANINDDIENFPSVHQGSKLGRVTVSIQNVPVAKIEFNFEGKPYTLHVFGENNLCYYESLPEKHSYKAGWLRRLMLYFTKTKRRRAFMYIAGYIFKSDEKTAEAETEMFTALLNEIKLSNADKEKLKSVMHRTHSLEEIKPFINCVKKDRRSLIFAWHCITADKEETAAEEAAFKRLTELYKVDAAEVENIKKKAHQFSGLTTSQMLEEYFN